MPLDNTLFYTPQVRSYGYCYPIADFRTEAASVGTHVCFCNKMAIGQG